MGTKRMLVAADNLHAMNPVVADALARLDKAPVQEIARTCVRHGADLIDLNPGYLTPRNEDRMAFLLEAVQEVTSARLILDSPKARILARGLEVCRETPVINALSREPEKVEEILPLAATYGTDLVVLLMDERSFSPPTTEEKIALALELQELAASAGVTLERLIFDPVLPNLSWEDSYQRVAEDVKTIRVLSSGAIFQEQVRTMVGLSNLRSGYSGRYPVAIDQTWLALFAGAGLNLVLANVLNPDVQATLGLVMRLG